MSAVLASYVKMSTLVDGTMRVVLDIEPTAAPEAFAMLGAPGSPIALARITDAAAVAQDRKQQGATEKKPLSLASKVALTCTHPTFWEFCKHHASYQPEAYSVLRAMDKQHPEVPFSHADYAAMTVRCVCDVHSRSDITEGSEAQRRWLQMEADYHDWQRRRAA